MTKPLPKKVVVGARTYTVSVDKDHLNNEAINAGARRGIIGLTDQLNLDIHLHPEMARDVTQETLLHEVLHCVTEVSGLSVSLGRNRDEAVVTRMAPVLLDVMRRNRALIEYLLDIPHDRP